MAENKVDELTSSEKLDASLSAQKAAFGVKNMEKALIRSLDESKADSIIALSPQWMYAKPSETKTELASAPGDKKERRRAATENESSRHWHEEERYTAILGQRDCMEEDRRANKVSDEGRGSTSADRWNDAGNGSSGLETPREGRWSARWGPDDKEKDSQSEKRMSTEKEDSLNDNKSFVRSIRATYECETDSRDKWRPHHRLEVHSSGPLGYHTSPGFRIERGRLEGSNVGFAPGRGNSSIMGNRSPEWPSLTLHIGAPLDRNACIYEKLNLSSDTFRYSRGKILDIYRKQSLDSSFNDVPKGLEEVLPITELNSNIPLAFISPGAEEEAVLSDIFKGKPTNRGILCNPSRNKIMCSNENVTGIGEMISTQRKHGIHTVNTPVETRECFPKVDLGNACEENGTGEIVGYASHLNMLNERDPSNKEDCLSDQLKDNGILSIAKAGEYMNPNDVSMFKQSNVENFSAVPVDISTELPDDSGFLFDKPASEEVPVSHKKYSRSNEEANFRTKSTSLKELSLYYKDPLGRIQGPFLAADIISGFDQGFFGTDLLVRLSDAPEGTPLRELGDLITNLKSSAGSNATTEPIPRVEVSDSIVGTSTSHEFHGPTVINEHQLATSDVEGLSVRGVYSGISGNEDFMFPGLPGNDNDNLIRKQFGNHYDTLGSATTNSFLANGAAETSMLNHKDVKPKDNHMKRTFLSKSASESDHSQCLNPNVLGNPPFGTHEEHSFGVTTDSPLVQEAWSGNRKSDTVSNGKSGNGHQSLYVEQDSRLFEQDRRLFDLAEQLNSLKLQNKLYQKDNQFSPFPSMHLNAHVVQNAGLSQSKHPVHPQLPINQAVSDLEHLLKLHAQRQRQFQVQKNHMEQQQLHHQNMQLLHNQNSQVQQLLLEQLLHQHMHDPGYEQSGVDDLRNKTMLSQVMLRQNVEQGGMHHSRSPSGHPDPKLEQVIQATSGQGLQRERLGDLYGQVLPSELQYRRQQEQMQANLYSMTSRNKMFIDEGPNNAVWSVDKICQFTRTGSNPLLDASTEISPFNYHQQQQSPSSCEEHLNFVRNLKILECQQQGIYEQNTGPFDRSRSLPACGPGMNLDVEDALARAEGLYLQERQNHIHSARRMGFVTSGIYDHHPQVPRQFHTSNKDANEGQSCVRSGNSMDPYLQLQIGREKREVEVNMSPKGQNSRFPTIGDDGITSSTDRRDSSSIFPGSSSSSYSYNNHRSGGSSSFVEGRQSSNLGNSLQNCFVKEDISHHSNSLESGDRLFNISHSGPLTEEQFSVGMKESAQALYGNAGIVGTSSVRTESRDGNQGMRGRYKSWALGEKQLLEIQGRMAEQSGNNAKNKLHIPAITPIRHDQLGITDENIGFCNYNVGMDNRYGEDMSKGRVSLIPLKGFDNSSLPLWDTSSSLREALSELDSNTTSERKSAPSFGTFDDWRQRI